MRLHDILNELTFMGSTCTKDCSGHKAGFDWGNKNKRVATGNSQSFVNGTNLAVNKMKRTQGGGKVAGIRSMTPNAIRKRDARAARKSTNP